MPKQNTQYKQVTLEQRYQISAHRQAGYSLREIGKQTGLDHSAVSRELRRNLVDGVYSPDKAHITSVSRKRSAFKANKKNKNTDEIIEASIKMGWSPEAISQRMALELERSESLSRDTIYSRIEEEKHLGGKLYQYLPRFGKTRWKGGKRRKDAGVRLIPNRIDITKRPDIVEERVRLGDWEGDTVHGQDAHLVTLVDRTSRFTLVKRVFSKTKEEVSSAIIVMLSGVHTALTLTLDNGGEFAGHETITEETKVDVFFAKPHASWQRGTNENTNGRLRRFWPKKFKMGSLTDKEIEDRVFMLNCTPRKVLGGLTPYEAFTGKRVALIT